MDNASAQAQLAALLAVPGALKIILPFHAHEEGLVTDAMIAADRKWGGPLAARCDAFTAETGKSVKHPLHYRLVDVARLEGPDDKGRMVAYADDAGGSSCRGEPAALLMRLTEHQRG